MTTMVMTAERQDVQNVIISHYRCTIAYPPHCSITIGRTFVGMSAALPVPLPAVSALKDVDVKLMHVLAEQASDPDFWSPRVPDRTDSAHCIFQYPAMMVPVVQRRLLGAVLAAQTGVKSLYDPFVGSGTSLVSGMHYGLAVHGNDINPLAVLISRVRTAREIDGSVRALCEEVVQAAASDGSDAIETELKNWRKWFKPEVAEELSRLRRAIRKQNNLWVRRFLWVTLAETVRLTSNDRTSTYKLHARPADEISNREISPIQVFGELSLRNSTSFAKFWRALRKANVITGNRYNVHTEILLADSRDNLTCQWSSDT